jgi:predicted RNA-binding protein with TRAM domain
MSAAPTAALDGVEYELELLSYQHEGNAKIVGVLALVPGRDRGRHPRQALLLASIAEHLGAPRTP